MLKSQNIQRAIACGTAGWVVSFGMVHWGGPMARHLPNDWFHITAFWGALVSGYILARGFGRAGPWGWALAAISACVATLLGALIGGATIALFMNGEPSGGAALGLIAVADAADSHWLIITWICAMAAVDGVARWVPATRLPSVKDIFS